MICSVIPSEKGLDALSTEDGVGVSYLSRGEYYEVSCSMNILGPVLFGSDYTSASSLVNRFLSGEVIPLRYCFAAAAAW